MAFRDPFRLVPMSELAEAADVFIRGEVFAANDFRTSLGYKPSKDPKANELRNPNMPEEEPIRTTAQVDRKQLTAAPSESKPKPS